jgi:two-component system response regulator HydG
MQADGGTVFLDEVGETSSRMQAKLLRVLQEKEIQRVGSEAVLQVDVRVVAATNRDLEEDVQAGRFREDLFYRLNVMHLNVPPLRGRQEDIPLLAQHFLEKYARRNRKTVKGFAPLAMDMLLKYDWPGNVRELENAIERAVILLSGDHVTEKQLPLRIMREHPGHEPAADAAMPATDGTRTLEEMEKEAIMTTLAATDDNKSETARRLGISRKTLHNKLKAYGLG